MIYGAGDVGKDIYKTLRERNINNIVCFIDQKATTLPPIDEIEVWEPVTLKSIDYDFVVVSTLAFAGEVASQLKAMGAPEEKILAPVKFNYLDIYNILTDFYSNKK